MASAAVKTKTLTRQDLDLDVTYQGDLRTDLFNPSHSYHITEKTEDAYFQKCAICGRDRQARFRVTCVNLTTGEPFYMGLDCLEKHFGITEEELNKSTLLTSLARVWEAYARKIGQEAAFGSTREAVEDMFQKFSRLALKKSLFVGAAADLRRILDDLAHISDYRPDVIALQNLVGILYEAQVKPTVRRDRIVAATNHPLLGPHGRANAERVLKLENATWAQLKNYTETFMGVAKKPIPIRIKQVPVYNFGDEGDYQEALRAHANARLAALDAHDRTYRADEYHQKVREKAGALKDAPGYCEFVFESPSFSSLERLQLPTSVEKALGKVVYLISPAPASYIHYHVT